MLTIVRIQCNRVPPKIGTLWQESANPRNKPSGSLANIIREYNGSLANIAENPRMQECSVPAGSLATIIRRHRSSWANTTSSESRQKVQ